MAKDSFFMVRGGGGRGCDCLEKRIYCLDIFLWILTCSLVIYFSAFNLKDIFADLLIPCLAPLLPQGKHSPIHQHALLLPTPLWDTRQDPDYHLSHVFTLTAIFLRTSWLIHFFILHFSHVYRANIHHHAFLLTPDWDTQQTLLDSFTPVSHTSITYTGHTEKRRSSQIPHHPPSSLQASHVKTAREAQEAPRLICQTFLY